MIHTSFTVEELRMHDARIREDALGPVRALVAEDWRWTQVPLLHLAFRAVIDTPAQEPAHEHCADPECRRCWGPNLLDTPAQTGGEDES